MISSFAFSTLSLYLISSISVVVLCQQLLKYPRSKQAIKSLLQH